MTDAIGELRVRAEILHKKVKRGDPGALARLRKRRAAGMRRLDCLNAIAAELGFHGWDEAKRVLSGGEPSGDFGTLLWSDPCGAHFNRWYRTYEEAAAVWREGGGYLLAYRRHYVIVDRYYIESLGLDPDDRDWETLGFNWVEPRIPAARARIYAKLVANLPREAAAHG
jgi:hypothetical protein